MKQWKNSAQSHFISSSIRDHGLLLTFSSNSSVCCQHRICGDGELAVYVHYCQETENCLGHFPADPQHEPKLTFKRVKPLNCTVNGFSYYDIQEAVR